VILDEEDGNIEDVPPSLQHHRIRRVGPVLERQDDVGPSMGTQPGRRTGSARSRNSPGMEEACSGRWRISESAWRFMGMKGTVRSRWCHVRR
jgi:hypothetical protein